MRFLCIVLPPVAVLLCGKPFQAVLNFFLTLFLWLPGVIHAWLVVSDRNADRRTQRTIEAQRQAALEAAYEAAHTSPAPPAPQPGYTVAPTTTPVVPAPPQPHAIGPKPSRVLVSQDGEVFRVTMFTPGEQVIPSGEAPTQPEALDMARTLAHANIPALVEFTAADGQFVVERIPRE